MADIEFGRNENGAPTMINGDPRFRPFASQLVSDIQTYAPDCLQLLQCIDDVVSGRSDYEEYEGNSAVVRCTPTAVTVESLGPMPSGATYSHDEARMVILRYFDFLAPSAGPCSVYVPTGPIRGGRVA
ncbi:hypothetical protein O7600_03255 [Micromonospora sp. WMMA1998]|uniref:hypothetical protein n=1 Tax=Micromonospora sp. WMMA1998 TaxID=3015167 RepID=UPI00248C033E|nr:hypothetical protein [Micromonospora sp. WMMA1998]WBC15873.1 hypothetical protein O7600_03255 [Micromonospora sp. WMMA1998]